jgi:hypothetical protein
MRREERTYTRYRARRSQAQLQPQNQLCNKSDGRFIAITVFCSSIYTGEDQDSEIQSKSKCQRSAGLGDRDIAISIPRSRLEQDFVLRICTCVSHDNSWRKSAGRYSSIDLPLPSALKSGLALYSDITKAYIQVPKHTCICLWFPIPNAALMQ